MHFYQFTLLLFEVFVKYSPICRTNTFESYPRSIRSIRELFGLLGEYRERWYSKLRIAGLGAKKGGAELCEGEQNLEG